MGTVGHQPWQSLDYFPFACTDSKTYEQENVLRTLPSLHRRWKAAQDLEGDSKAKIIGFLHFVLRWVPEERKTAGELLQHHGCQKKTIKDYEYAAALGRRSGCTRVCRSCDMALTCLSGNSLRRIRIVNAIHGMAPIVHQHRNDHITRSGGETSDATVLEHILLSS